MGRFGAPGWDAERIDQKIAHTLHLAQVLRVSERQFQRWESVGGVPPEVWLRYKMTYGHRFPADFEIVEDGVTRGWNPDNDKPRESIEDGDRVHLHATNGTMIQATVWLDRVNEGVVDEENYGGHVVDSRSPRCRP